MARWSGLLRCWHVDTMPRRASRIIRTPRTHLLYPRTGTLPQWTAPHRSDYHKRLVRATTILRVRVEDHNDSPEHNIFCDVCLAGFVVQVALLFAVRIWMEWKTPACRLATAPIRPLPRYGTRPQRTTALSKSKLIETNSEKYSSDY